MNLRLALNPALFVILTGCSDMCSSDTVARAASPSGRVEALLDENGCGATTSFGYVVSLKAAGSPGVAGYRVASAYGPVRNDQAYGMTLVWVDESTLEVQYWEARWVTIERPSISIDGVQIAIRMKGDVRDDSAPAGGMLHNLQRRSAAEGAR